MVHLLACLLLSLTGAARAQGAMDQLKLAQAQGSGEQVFDGDAPRLDGDYEILSERKNVLVERRFVPEHRVCDANDYCDQHGGCGGFDHNCYPIPAHTLYTYGDVQTLRIHDREQYKRHAANVGMTIGAALGALGFLAVLSLGPLGYAVGMLAFGVGACLGSYAGQAKAAADPEVFERVVNEHSTSVE